MPTLQETLAAYVPMDRRHALLSGHPLPTKSSGAVLFADVSGFTPLTSTLVNILGNELGVETLRDQLNQVCGGLIDVVHQYRGSVIHFAGDAIMCWFDGDQGKRATAAAFAMQRVMQRFQAIITPDNQAILLGIKVAIAAGELSRFLVGHARIMSIDVLAGRLMDCVARAEKLIDQNQIVVTANVAEQLPPTAVSQWRTDPNGEQFAILSEIDFSFSPTPWPTTDILDTQISRDWLLPPVYQRLSQGMGEFLAELRPAVALFARFDGIDYDGDPEAGEKLDALIGWVQEVLSRYEGSLLQVITGDKGSHFYALFGAPIAHEDDSDRAVNAALDLQKLPAALSFIEPMPIGISQGVMYVGSYGGYNRRTYSGLGQQVNLAARLMSKAEPGQILVTQAVAKTAVRFAYQALGPQPIKGMEETQPLFSVQDRQSPTESGTLKGRTLVNMVGRAAELALLDQKIDALLNGRSSQIIIEGEAGIGKSRLVAELQAQAAEKGVPTLLGAGDAIEQNTPYHAWRPVFAQLFGLRESDEGTLVQKSLLAKLRGPLLERAPLLNAVLPLNLPDNELTAQLTGEVRAGNTRELLVTAIQQAPRSASALLLILEDAHWLDSASWALLEAVQRAMSSLMVVVVTRPMQQHGQPGRLPTEYQQLLTHPETEHLRLTSLSPQEATQLVCRRLGVSTIPEPVAALIHKRAEGHPFFSEEIAYALRDTGLITVENGRCRLTASRTEFQAVEFPDTIQGVITSRIDRLDPGQQLTLKVASVIGRVFLLRALHAVHPVESDKPRLQAYLENLDRLDITPMETPEPEMSYIFKHITIQEVAYSLLLFSQRQQLHFVTAQWLEQAYAHDPVPHYPLLAHHWQRANELVKAIRYLEKAGEEALRNGAYQEAIDFISQVVELAETLPEVDEADEAAELLTDFRQAHWQQLLGDAYFGLGQLPESRQYFLRALELLDWPMPESPPSKTAVYLGIQVLNYLRLITIPDPLRLWFRRPTAASREKLLAAAHAYEPLGLVYYFANETILAVYTALHRFILAKKAGTATSELARGYASVCGIFMIAGLHKFGREYGRQARQITREINDQPALAWALLSTSVFGIGIEPWEALADWLREAIQLDQYLRDKRAEGDCTSVLAAVLMHRGDFMEALTAAQDLQKLGTESGNLEHHTWGIVGEASVQLRQGETETAVSQLTHALDLFSRIEADFIHEAEALGLLAQAHLRLGRMSLALAAADRIHALVGDQVPSSYVLYNAYVGMATAYLAHFEQENSRPARDRANLAMKQMARFARLHPLGKPRYWLLNGRFAWQQGHQRQAWRRWRKALQFAKEMKMPYELGSIYLEMAAQLPDSDPLKQQYLTAAEAHLVTIQRQTGPDGGG